MSDDVRTNAGSGSREQPSDAEILRRWYRFAARQPGSVGELLALLRKTHGHSVEQQCREFDLPAAAFAHLESLRAPRSDLFLSDAQRIAETCHVGQPFAFVQALLLARGLRKQPAHGRQINESEVPEWESYQAAFDAVERLDTDPDGEDED